MSKKLSNVEINVLSNEISKKVNEIKYEKIKSKLEKDNAIKSMSNIYETAFYNSLMKQMGDYYDMSEPLLIICDNIIKYHYDKIFIYGWEDNVYGVWSHKKMLEDYNKVSIYNRYIDIY